MISIKFVKVDGNVLTKFLSALYAIDASVSTEFTHAEQNKVTVNIGISHIENVEIVKRINEDCYQLIMFGVKKDDGPNLESFSIRFVDIDYIVF